MRPVGQWATGPLSRPLRECCCIHGAVAPYGQPWERTNGPSRGAIAGGGWAENLNRRCVLSPRIQWSFVGISLIGSSLVLLAPVSWLCLVLLRLSLWLWLRSDPRARFPFMLLLACFPCPCRWSRICCNSTWKRQLPVLRVGHNAC
jgi:hypothetical protein